MNEILQDKILWKKVKFKEKEETQEKNENLLEEKKPSVYNKMTEVEDVKPVEKSIKPGDDREKQGEVDAFKLIENKVIGLYFAANWCTPCQEFTYLLKQTYDELKERSSPFEVIFISFDKKLEDMKVFFTEKHGDWLAVPHKDPIVEILKSKYDIKAIPKLIVIRDNGTVITEKGRKDIQDKGIVCFRGWLQKANLSPPKPSQQTITAENTKETDKEKTVSFSDNVSSFN